MSLLLAVPCVALVLTGLSPSIPPVPTKDKDFAPPRAISAPAGEDPVAGERTRTLVRLMLGESEAIDEGSSVTWSGVDGHITRFTALNQTAPALLEALWDLEDHEIDASAVDDERRFDLVMHASIAAAEAVNRSARAMVLAELGLRVRTEERDVRVWELREGEGGIRADAPDPEGPEAGGNVTTILNDRWVFKAERAETGGIVGLIRDVLRNTDGGPPVVNATGLEGEYAFEVELPWARTRAGFDDALREQLNLRLVETDRPTSVRVFEPAD